MSNVLEFPNKFRDTSDTDIGLYPLLGIPHLEVFDRVVSANQEMLHYTETDCLTLAESLELFMDPEHPGKVLADIDDWEGVTGLRGVYEVDMNDYTLRRMGKSPLHHFK